MKILKYCCCFLLVLGNFSCSNNDDLLVQCAAIDYAIPGLIIEFIDSNGINLIDNGTYDKDEIKVIINDTKVSRIVEQEDGTVLNVLLSDALDNKEAQVILSSVETDILKVALTRTTTGSPCFFAVFRVDEVSYNAVNQSLEEIPFNYKITIVK
ncbi:hypothetical protein [Ascidiimonas sp. W6]|uniref:hypothetical protein n=1 Tax=Ascidiimonas meishanensis TaxID=3128903 RepID=UPI0030EBF28F